MTYGTAYFPTINHAIRYYKPYGDGRVEVENKIKEGSIHIGEPALKEGQTLTLIDEGTRYAIVEPGGYKSTHENLMAVCLDAEGNKKTCNYWYAVTSGAMAHTAFETTKGLLRWAEERGLTLESELPPIGTFAVIKVNGSYRSEHHMDYDYFYGLKAIIETKTLSNGDYTLARITQDPDGLRTVHTLNPNCKKRPVYNYRTTASKMR